MIESRFTLFEIRGIPIGVHWSWVLVFGIFAYSLGTEHFPRTFPGLDPSTALGMGIVSTILVFASILVHELGHALRAMKEGMRIDGITLWLFGGVARFLGMFPSSGAEFRIAVAGPVVSVVIGALCSGLAWAGQSLGWPVPVRGVLGYLGRINLVLVAFNLVPALPLDGGRILRAWLWHRRRDFARATVTAARAGQAFGMTLITLGLLILLATPITGLWIALIGWFIIQAAHSETSFILLRRGLSDARVRDLMTPEPAVVSPNLTINGFFQEASCPEGHSVYPVTRDGQCIGLVTLRLAGSVPPEQRDSRTVAEIMMTGGDIPALTPDTPMLEALERLRSEPSRAVVLDGGRIIGIISVSDVTRTLEVEAARSSSTGQTSGTLGTRRSRLIWLGTALAIAAVAAYLYRPPMAVVSPGPAIDISRDATISGVPTQAPNGRYLLTSVRLSQPNAFGVILAWLDPSRRVLPAAAFIPPGMQHGNFAERQRALFRDSQMQAAAAAASAAGLEVSFDGTGAEVVAVLEGSPASAFLKPGDVLVEIEDRPIHLASQIREIVGSRPPGSEFRLRFERSGSARSVTIKSARLSQDADAIFGIGVYLATRNVKIDLPFQIEFRERDIGGPSAGLAYALALADILDSDDLARGRTIAATGTIDVTGRVGPVGAVQEKAEGAKRAGAKVFLVPNTEIRSAGRQNLNVRGVTTLNEALSALHAPS